MQVTVLGCGTSGGVPRISGPGDPSDHGGPGGYWGDCDPSEPRNRRRRVSILVEKGDTVLLVDTSPDLRAQCLDHAIHRLDAVLYTHDHADHTHGIDELRAFAVLQRGRVPVYGDRATLATLRKRFDYAFESTTGYPPICEAHPIGLARFSLGEVDVVPFEQQHGPVTSLGFRFGSVAYSTDLNGLDEAAFQVLDGVDTWIVDALRYRPHPTHANLEQTLSWIERLRPRRAILTHMTWEMDYQTLLAELPPGVEPAYDGLVIEHND